MTSRRAKRQRARKKHKDRDMGDTVTMERGDAFVHLAARTRYAEPGGVVEEVTTIDDRRAITKRIRPPVEVYFAQDKLTKRQLDAAEHWYRDFIFGVEKVRECERIPGVSQAGGPTALSAAQIDAITRYRLALNEVAPGDRPLVKLVVLHEKPVAMACKMLGRRNHFAMRFLGYALDAIADHYRLVG